MERLIVQLDPYNDANYLLLTSHLLEHQQQATRLFGDLLTKLAKSDRPAEENPGRWHTVMEGAGFLPIREDDRRQLYQKSDHPPLFCGWERDHQDRIQLWELELEVFFHTQELRDAGWVYDGATRRYSLEAVEALDGLFREKRNETAILLKELLGPPDFPAMDSETPDTRSGWMEKPAKDLLDRGHAAVVCWHRGNYLLWLSVFHADKELPIVLQLKLERIQMD
ncbi:hypothetical protein GCM10011571_27540 [Marinithermofilum abyssi]|uniref:Uncharacterized protein n=1 Tax=Marinithermofilum abyssi TaxID=1571185 RepID=A0A8J2VHP4_9BACL|nr:hypothetical protein [Marinithermofilum abyssi]GGE23944.1 hypothetical protein GCM10011571_27540 [Marinithermofilum abyssi]